MPLPSALTTPVPSTEQMDRSLETHRSPVILLPVRVAQGDLERLALDAHGDVAVA